MADMKMIKRKIHKMKVKREEKKQQKNLEKEKLNILKDTAHQKWLHCDKLRKIKYEELEKLIDKREKEKLLLLDMDCFGNIMNYLNFQEKYKLKLVSKDLKYKIEDSIKKSEIDSIKDLKKFETKYNNNLSNIISVYCTHGDMMEDGHFNLDNKLEEIENLIKIYLILGDGKNLEHLLCKLITKMHNQCSNDLRERFFTFNFQMILQSRKLLRLNVIEEMASNLYGYYDREDVVESDNDSDDDSD